MTVGEGIGSTAMADEREIMSWDTFGTASRGIAQMVADDGYDPEMILAIARGGLLIGGALGYAMAVKNVYTMNVEFYTGVDERLEVPRILPPAPDFVDLHDAAHPDRRRCRRHGPHVAQRAGVLRGQGGRSAHRGAVRESPLGGEVRLRVEADEPVDQLSLERQGPGHRPRQRCARRLTAVRSPNGIEDHRGTIAPAGTPDAGAGKGCCAR